MTQANNIPQHGSLPDDKLMAYLEGKLTPEEQREVEALLAEEGMDSDALEGLKEIPTGEAKQLASRINYKLQIDLKKKRRLKRDHFSDNKWAWLAVLIILMLCILGYFVIEIIK